jgi:hypothetical protein
MVKDTEESRPIKGYVLINEIKKRPPRGIVPKFIHDERRFKDLVKTIKRYIKHYKYIDPNWISEYNELLEKISKDENNKV